MDEIFGASGKHPVPVVRLIILDESGRVLVLRRRNTSHAPGEWCLPGGKVEYCETVEQAIVKEVMEETSLACVGSRFLFYQDSVPLRSGGMHCINFYFECSVEGEILLNDESSEFAWIGPDDLARFHLVFRNDEGLSRYWKEKGAATGGFS